ncbi:MAG: hypothetical protein JO319_16700, partial [Acidobacteriaceae bacterium]|nr:hypothetical protein [Acidobacteriaceae bacterium]
LRWHAITYEKGAWILHMLHERLGDEGFRAMQLKLLNEYASKPITNDEFRVLAASFVPADQPDRSLILFFDTWVYGTGIPSLHLGGEGKRLEVIVSGVDDNFTVDVPLACKSSLGKEAIKWVRVTSGQNPIELTPGLTDCALPSPANFLFVH